MKLLQKIENRQYQDLVFKAQYMRDQQEKKFEQEMQVTIEGQGWGRGCTEGEGRVHRGYRLGEGALHIPC